MLLWNLRPISVLIRASVHLWSGQPWATGPLASSSSRTANNAWLSFGRQAGPRDRRACCPLSCHARRHRWTDRTLTRNSLAISGLLRPAANMPPASNRIRSRNACLSAVRPPPCGYLMHPAYRDDHQPSAPTTPRLQAQ